MLQVMKNQYPEVVDDIQPITAFPLSIEVRPAREIEQLIANLSPQVPWGQRQSAAKRLGSKKALAAVPALLEGLPTDPFWMVRCAIIQALERIGDPNAIPTLRKVAQNDSFQVVCSYAAKAIERLS
jgi:HEAT repeat protein